VSSRRRGGRSPSLYGEEEGDGGRGRRTTASVAKRYAGGWGSGWAGPARRGEEVSAREREKGPSAPSLYFFFLLKGLSFYCFCKLKQTRFLGKLEKKETCG
jgi:hypothetical protein